MHLEGMSYDTNHYYHSDFTSETRIDSAKVALALFKEGKRILKSVWYTERGTHKGAYVATGTAKVFGKECLRWSPHHPYANP